MLNCSPQSSRPAPWPFWKLRGCTVEDSRFLQGRSWSPASTDCGRSDCSASQQTKIWYRWSLWPFAPEPCTCRWWQHTVNLFIGSVFKIILVPQGKENKDKERNFFCLTILTIIWFSDFFLLWRNQFVTGINGHAHTNQWRIGKVFMRSHRFFDSRINASQHTEKCA